MCVCTRVYVCVREREVHRRGTGKRHGVEKRIAGVKVLIALPHRAWGWLRARRTPIAGCVAITAPWIAEGRGGIDGKSGPTSRATDRSNARRGSEGRESFSPPRTPCTLVDGEKESRRVPRLGVRRGR